MTRVLAVLVATLAALMGFGAPAVAADEAALASATVYAYDRPHLAAAPAPTTSERGPPSAINHTATDDAVDDWSRGASARPQGTATPTHSTYAHPATDVQAKWATTTTNGHVVVARGATSSLPASQDAANNAPSRIPARDVRFTQDSVGPTFKNGQGVLDAGENWAAAGRAPDWMDADPVRLFRENGNIYSLDNRRLLAGQYADVDLPYRWATPGEIATRTRTEIFGGTSTMLRFRGAFRGDTSNWAWWQR